MRGDAFYNAVKLYLNTATGVARAGPHPPRLTEMLHYQRVFLLDYVVLCIPKKPCETLADAENTERCRTAVLNSQSRNHVVIFTCLEE